MPPLTCPVCQVGHNGTDHRDKAVYPGLLRHFTLSASRTGYQAGTLIRWERVFDPTLPGLVRVFTPDGDRHCALVDDLIVPRSA